VGTCSFKEIEEVCKRLGLTRYPKKKGIEWKGMDANGKLLSVIMHMHSGGRDIADGTFYSMIRGLDFKNEQDFKDFLSDRKRTR